MGACSSEAAPGTVLKVNVHTLPHCGPPSPLLHGSLELLALGDFDASNESAEVLTLDAQDSARGTALKFPPTTRAIEARLVTQGDYFGYSEHLRPGSFDVLLWPELEHCSVFRPDGTQGYPGKGGGQALGFARSQGLLLAAGGNDALVSDAIVGALSFNVATGAVTSFDTSQGSVLREARAFATVSELGDNLLVAGGQSPVFGVPEEDLELRETAEVFDPKAGTFVGEPIKLAYPRTHHAAVTLTNGDTLLVGGWNHFGDASREQQVAEVISSKTRLAQPMAALAARIDPRALLLSDGRVFVGGGATLAGTLPEKTGEWLSEDGKKLLPQSSDFPGRISQAFVAMPGGGVLAIGGCEDRTATSKTESLMCSVHCQRGCPLLGTDEQPRYDGWWLDSDGGVQELDLTGISAPQPLLLPGSDASPWLVAALSNDPGTPRLFRFNPWTERFTLADVADTLRLPRPDGPDPVRVDADTFLWIDDSDGHSELFGLRLGTRNRYAQDLALVLLADPMEPSRPQHLAPDRPLNPSASYALSLELDATGNEPPVTVLITDTDYADVSITLHLESGELPLVLLGETELGGGGDCAWPEPGAISAELPSVVRDGDRAELRFQGNRHSCSVPAGRLPLGFRARPGSRSSISQIDVRRGS